MNAQRLKEIKRKRNYNEPVYIADVDWLISQAQQLEEAEAKIQFLEAKLLIVRSQREEGQERIGKLEKSIEALIYWICQFPPKSDQMVRDIQEARQLSQEGPK